MNKYRFYKNEYKDKIRWWVDIKPWVFPKRLLIMYPSAEAWLEKIGEGKDEIVIEYSTKTFEGAEILEKKSFEGPITGTMYEAKEYKNTPTNHEVLLCPVTLYVFGRYPKAIYYQVQD